MTSRFESTPVDDLDVGNFSDEDLRDIADNDSRVTAQQKATAELNRRDTSDEGAPSADQGTARLDANDVKERANPRDEAPVTDSRGYETSPASEDLGAGQVQHQVNLANASGTWPGDGSPPDATHTVEAVTQFPAAAGESAPDPATATDES